MQTANDGTRSLFESILPLDIIQALKDWTIAVPGGVLIGTLALSYYVKPRMTQNIDMLFLSDGLIPVSVSGFERVNPHLFRHLATGTDINIITPERFAIQPETVQRVIATAREDDGIKIASPSGLVALRLSQNGMRATADMVDLLKTTSADITNFELHPVAVDRFLEISRIAGDEKQRESNSQAHFDADPLAWHLQTRGERG